MQHKEMAKKIGGVLLSAVITATMALPVLAADPESGANIPRQTIPVTAEINTYYEIVTPAGLDGNGAIRMTRDHNDYVKSNGDTTSTFYGFTTVGMQGEIESGRKVTATLKCADMVSQTNASDTAAVGIQSITDELGGTIESIWGGSTSESVDFGGSRWTGGTSGIVINFAQSEVRKETPTNKYAMLRTTLPRNGQYDSNLVIDFALADA